MEKIIRIYNYPYAFDAKVKFGTFNEMIENSKKETYWDGGVQVILGGSFNKKMERRTKAAMLYIGVMYFKCMDVSNVNYGMFSAKTICDSPWEGVYWDSGYFDEEMKNKMFPVSVDWMGKIYVKDGKFDNSGHWVSWYKETDEFPY